MQRVQNAAARLVTSTPRYCHITPILYELHWLPVKFRINLKLLLITFKALYGMAPKYIADLLNIKKKGNYSLRSNDSIMLEYPNEKSWRSFGDRSFSVVVTKLWNELAEGIRKISSINVFKTALKTHLFKSAFSI